MRLWLDDVREMPDGFDVWARTYEDAVDCLESGEVTMISLDNDLGQTLEGYDVAKFIAAGAYFGRIPPLEWAVHTANPVGRLNITQTMQAADRYWAMTSKSSRRSNSGSGTGSPGR